MFSPIAILALGAPPIPHKEEKALTNIIKGKVNPMIGAAGVSAVPMAARVVHKIGQEEDPENFLLMHAMGPNVAGVIGSAVAAGILLSMIG